MMGALLEQAPTVTGAVLIYPLLLERKHQVLRASVLEGNTDPRLEAAMDAFQEDLTALEFSLVEKQGLSAILEEGEVVVRVFPGQKPSSLRFEVCDTGIGIAPEKIEGLFEPFTQIDATCTRRYAGTVGFSSSTKLSVRLPTSIACPCAMP